MILGGVQISRSMSWSAPRRAGSGAPASFSLLPYSMGLLQAYAEAHARERHQWLLPLYRRISVDDAVERLQDCDVLAVSIYIWNEQLSLAIARELKRRRPETLVVFGGPQVPDRAEDFLRRHPFIDIVCHGEGEAVFTEILDNAAAADWSGIASVSYLRPDGVFEHHPKRPRIADLDTIPSPYLAGVFGPLMDANPQEGWVMTWETNRGCPFSCTFCDWGSATAAKVLRFGMERLLAEIAWMSEQRMGFVFCCDANFGMLPRDLDIAQAVVAAKEKTGYPFSLSVQNTKNARERAYEVQKLISRSMNSIGVTISLQTVSDDTLKNIKRANISSEAFEELQRRFAADGIYTYTDLILGLPGESYDTFADGVSRVVANGQHNHIQFHNCSVLPNAEMGDPEYLRRFGLRTVAQEIQNVHDQAGTPDEPREYLPVVVATDAMPADDWCRTKVFAWLTDLLYFDRLLQVPLAVLTARHGVPLRRFVEAVARADAARHPVLHRMVSSLESKARAIQHGDSEYFEGPAGLLWPADQYLLVRLVLDGELESAYEEAAALLVELLRDLGVEESRLLVLDLVDLNRAILSVPFQTTDLNLVLSHRVWEAYEAVLHGRPVEVTEGFAVYGVDRTSRTWGTVESWCEHLVWCHGKDKRGYLYGRTRPTFLRAPRGEDAVVAGAGS